MEERGLILQSIIPCSTFLFLRLLLSIIVMNPLSSEFHIQCIRIFFFHLWSKPTVLFLTVKSSDRNLTSNIFNRLPKDSHRPGRYLSSVFYGSDAQPSSGFLVLLAAGEFALSTTLELLDWRTEAWWEKKLIKELLIFSCHTLPASPCCCLTTSSSYTITTLSLRHCLADVSICLFVSLCL